MTIKVESIGAGLVGGGILSILYGVVRHWKYSDNILKVAILGIVLGILVWLGFRKFGNIVKKR